MAIFQIMLPRNNPSLQVDLASELVGVGQVEPSRNQPKDIGAIIAIISGGAQVAERVWHWYQRKRHLDVQIEEIMIVTPAGRRFFLRDVDLDTLRKLLEID